MLEKLNMTIKQISNEIIDLSTALAHKMEKWSDTATRPNDLDTTECVGFINKETAVDGIQIVVDLQAPPDNNQAILRTWAIDIQRDSNNIERFNNIQLEFAIRYDQARSVAQKGREVTREDMKALLNLNDTSLIHLVVSDQAGVGRDRRSTWSAL